MQLCLEEWSANTFTATLDLGVPLVSTDHDREIATGEYGDYEQHPNQNPNAGSLPQKGIVHYGLAQNRQNPLAGTLNAAIFNTFRRTRGQILYWGVPLLIAYETMQWAIEK